MEVLQDPDPILEGVESIQVGALKTKSAIQVAELQQLVNNGELEKVLNDFLSMYKVMAIKNEAFQALVKQLLLCKGPLLHHCTVGKDRTGIGSLIIYLLLGVGEEDILDEYLLTNQANYSPQWLMQLKEKFGNQQLFSKLLDVQEELLQHTFTSILETYGSYE